MKRIKLFTLTALLLAGITSYAQNIAVKGVVSEAATGDPVAGAVVQVNGSNGAYATTGLDGEYTIEEPLEIRDL